MAVLKFSFFVNNIIEAIGSWFNVVLLYLQFCYDMTILYWLGLVVPFVTIW
jgi:hypothetical protein